MKINLSPVASNKTTSVSVNSLVLTIDGVEYDLGAIPDGGQADAEEGSPFVGTLTRDRVMIRYEYDSIAAECHQPTDWSVYTFDVTDGVVPCPIIWKFAQEAVE